MSSGLSPTSVGAVAAEILEADGEAEVAAVFDRSCYIMTSHGYVAIGSETLGDGPLNVLLAAQLGPLDWIRLGITREAKGTVERGRLSIGDGFVLDSAGSPVWHPPHPPETSRHALAASVRTIRDIAIPLCPPEGLSRLVLTGSPTNSDRTARAAAPTVSELRNSLPAALTSQLAGSDLIRSATLLLGLGPGLTPSGDDFLGGVFLTLSALRQTALRDALWEAIAPELDLLTVGISAAHLAAAADGLGAAGIHRALDAILLHENERLAGHMAALRAFGHSSGFDTLAGIVATLDAALATDVLDQP